MAAHGHLSDFERLALRCLNSRKVYLCQKAIIRAETLQRLAADKENYSCQTSLLGLQSEFIIAQLENQRKNNSIEMVDKVKRFCMK